MFTPHKIERADAYAEYMARRAQQRFISAAIAAVCAAACGAIIMTLVLWAAP